MKDLKQKKKTDLVLVHSSLLFHLELISGGRGGMKLLRVDDQNYNLSSSSSSSNDINNHDVL